MKADAPSGTALHLGSAVERGRSMDAKEELGRCGTGLSREVGSIGYAAGFTPNIGRGASTHHQTAKVLVHRDDLDRAQQVRAAMRHDS